MNLVIGKFYPPHLGHHWLIDRALADGNTMVAIMWSEKEKIRPGLRKRWIRDVHTGSKSFLDFVLVKDELPIDFEDKELSFQHAKLIKDELTQDRLFPRRFDHVYGCESYVPHLAEYFEAEPVMLDRTEHPASSTMFREDPRGNWDLLKPPVKAGLCKRIVCVGAESCGTTTLARHLAEYYDTVWVPEYGRLYSDAIGNGNAVWEEQDFIHISRGHRWLEEEVAQRSRNGLLICDTNTLATHVWEESLLSSFWTPHSSGIACDPADLFILTDLCPWEDDGARFTHPYRAVMQSKFVEHLREMEVPWIKVTGPPMQRLYQAASAIDKLTWEF